MTECKYIIVIKIIDSYIIIIMYVTCQLKYYRIWNEF